MRFDFVAKEKIVEIFRTDPDTGEVEHSAVTLRKPLKNVVEKCLSDAQSNIISLQNMLQETLIHEGLKKAPAKKGPDSEEEQTSEKTNLTPDQIKQKGEIDRDFGHALTDLLAQGQIDYVLLFIVDWDFEGPEGDKLAVNSENLLKIRNFDSEVFQQIHLACKSMMGVAQKKADLLEKN